ncbi:MAG TPA: hypothetical protein VGX25_21825 [Actinophytocola sp.]|uniref:hypothetical protein n=1 Tax=Actinophytocola sp. TaxID=1872138 RepID=UPI002DDD6061|nr:hypothetical protein [Actinophytocola sp.]HEV2782038.1 hypothetical protein [Actinophytocola sp.]
MRATLIILALVAVAALTAACGQQVAGDAKAAENRIAGAPTTKKSTTPSKRPSSTSRPTSSRPPSSDRLLAGLAGTWEGEYTCAQGTTGLRLLISPPEDGSLPATFAFFALPENPAAKEGAYSMVGTVTPSGQLVFKQQQWINQPDGYVMVDIAVTSPIEEDTRQLSGDVLAGPCKGFSVRRR